MTLGVGSWVLLMLSVTVAFLQLVQVPATNFTAQLIARLLFAGIPLATLAVIAKRHTWALFGPFSARDAWIAVQAGTLAILSSLIAALVVRQFAPVAANALATGVAGMQLPDLILNLLSTAPQLLGEELLTILPFLALLWLSTRWGLGRRAGIAMALAGSTLIFCAAHLPTYDWNWAQCFIVIGASRLVLTLSYIITRKLWVSTTAHILTDWTEFVLAFAAAAYD